MLSRIPLHALHSWWPWILASIANPVKSIITLWPLRESARSALIQGGMKFAGPADREQAADLLAQNLLWTTLRYFPQATFRAVQQVGGPEVVAHLETHLPHLELLTDRRPIPTTWDDVELRRTPLEVRTLWGPCREAYDRVFISSDAGDSPDRRRIQVILALSWGLHTFSYALIDSYREWVHDVRRRQQLGEEITEQVMIRHYRDGPGSKAG